MAMALVRAGPRGPYSYGEYKIGVGVDLVATPYPTPMATVPPSTAAEDAALFAWLDQTPEEALE